MPEFQTLFAGDRPFAALLGRAIGGDQRRRDAGLAEGVDGFCDLIRGETVETNFDQVGQRFGTTDLGDQFVSGLGTDGDADVTFIHVVEPFSSVTIVPETIRQPMQTRAVATTIGVLLPLWAAPIAPAAHATESG